MRHFDIYIKQMLRSDIILSQKKSLDKKKYVVFESYDLFFM